MASTDPRVKYFAQHVPAAAGTAAQRHTIAKALADAEEYAEEQGWLCEWYDRRCDLMDDEGIVLASDLGIPGRTGRAFQSADKRVMEAYLALEAMTGSGGERPRRNGSKKRVSREAVIRALRRLLIDRGSVERSEAIDYIQAVGVKDADAMLYRLVTDGHFELRNERLIPPAPSSFALALAARGDRDPWILAQVNAHLALEAMTGLGGENLSEPRRNAKRSKSQRVYQVVRRGGDIQSPQLVGEFKAIGPWEAMRQARESLGLSLEDEARAGHYFEVEPITMTGK